MESPRQLALSGVILRWKTILPWFANRLPNQSVAHLLSEIKYHRRYVWISGDLVGCEYVQ